MPWGSSLFPLLIVTSSGRFTGLFVYSPAPGNGNLIASMTAAAGTDPFGNSFNAGITSYTHGGGLLINMLAGVLNFGDTLSADALTSLGLMRIIHMASHGAQPIVAIDAPAADTNTTHSSLWLLGAPQGYTSGPVQAAFFADNATGGSAGEAPLDLIVCPGAGGSLTFGAISAITGTPAGQVMKWLSPSGDTSGVTDSAALNHAFGVGNYQHVFLIPGTYYVTHDQVVLGLSQHLRGAGRDATVINLVGAGAGVGITVINTTGTYSQTKTASVRDLTIDMTSAAAGSTGVQAGDIADMCIDEVQVQHCTASGSVPFQFINKSFQTERLHGNIYIENCTASGIQFNCAISGGGIRNGSFDRCGLRMWVNTGLNSGVAAVTFGNGAQVNNPVEGFGIFGNIAAGGTGGAVLTITGSTPVGVSPASNSQISNGPFSMGVELDGAGGTTPVTIFFGGAVNGIGGTHGMWDFSQGAAFGASNNAGNVTHDGLILGDSTLVSGYFSGEVAGPSLVNGNTIVTTLGKTIRVTEAAAVTGIILQAGFHSGQVIEVINIGTASITFAVAATSNVADGVSDVIAALSGARYLWSTATSLWYRMH